MTPRRKYLVCYDIETVTHAGKKRLEKAGKLCCGYGTRVQDSVFECQLDERRIERLKGELAQLIKWDFDSVRIYSLGSAAGPLLMGVDLSEPLSPLVL